MALFQDATEILDNGNNKQVKKIEDSNGNIIWGSQTAFPYRRVEYLSFNGTDNYIASSFGTKVGYYREITMTLDEYANDDMRPFFTYDGNATNVARRWGFILGTSQGFRVSIGNQWSGSGSYPLTTYWPLNTKRTVGLRTYLDNSNHPIIFYTLKNENGVQIIGNSVTSSSTTTITSQAPFIMAGSTTGGSPEKYVKGKLYGVVERRTNESGTLLHNFIPCQRKSDGVCGIYDTVGGEFKVMNGSNVTAAAGPIVDEYWDLTA